MPASTPRNLALDHHEASRLPTTLAFFYSPKIEKFIMITPMTTFFEYLKSICLRIRDTRQHQHESSNRRQQSGGYTYQSQRNLV